MILNNTKTTFKQARVARSWQPLTATSTKNHGPFGTLHGPKIWSHGYFYGHFSLGGFTQVQSNLHVFFYLIALLDAQCIWSYRKLNWPKQSRCSIVLLHLCSLFVLSPCSKCLLFLPAPSLCSISLCHCLPPSPCSICLLFLLAPSLCFTRFQSHDLASSASFMLLLFHLAPSS